MTLNAGDGVLGFARSPPDKPATRERPSTRPRRGPYPRAFGHRLLLRDDVLLRDPARARPARRCHRIVVAAVVLRAGHRRDAGAHAGIRLAGVAFLPTVRTDRQLRVLRGVPRRLHAGL